MALFSCYSGLARQDLLLRSRESIGYFNENRLRKLLQNFERDHGRIKSYGPFQLLF